MHAAELERTQPRSAPSNRACRRCRRASSRSSCSTRWRRSSDLYRADAALGERMLDELIAYLRAAMPKMRDTSSTVGQEIELVRPIWRSSGCASASDSPSRSSRRPRIGRSAHAADDAAAARRPRARRRPERTTRSPGRSASALESRTARSASRSPTAATDSFLTREGEGIAGIRERLAALYGGDASLLTAPARWRIHRSGPRASSGSRRARQKEPQRSTRRLFPPALQQSEAYARRPASRRVPMRSQRSPPPAEAARAVVHRPDLEGARSRRARLPDQWGAPEDPWFVGGRHVGHFFDRFSENDRIRTDRRRADRARRRRDVQPRPAQALAALCVAGM